MNTNILSILGRITFAGGMVVLAVTFLSPVEAASLQELRSRLQNARQSVQQIEQQIKQHEAGIAAARQRAATLEDEVGIIEQGVRHLTLQIDKTGAEIEGVRAEINAVKEEQVLIKERIEWQREVLREFLRTLQFMDTDSTVTAFFKYPTLSQAISEVQQVYRAEQHGQELLQQLKDLQNAVRSRELAFVDLERELDGLRGRQESQKQTLEDQQAAKERLIEVTRMQEAELQRLREQGVSQYRQAEAQISQLDRQIREFGGLGTMSWPIDLTYGISCTFHCANYILPIPHTGIDVRALMGTPVRAAADGYVLGTLSFSGGYGNLIILAHGDNVDTYYAHLSSFAVTRGQDVTRGTLIGYSGNSGFSTGPHLHFEVRKNGVPVNPMQFLR